MDTQESEQARTDAVPRSDMTATYSPEDNKLRLYPLHRLDAETYARVKAAGFKWAPRQELFVAPMWTPEREDLLIELAGEVGDEDTSLVERAEERAERFEEYSEKREADAHRAHAAVASIADNIPLGQPILVGHHSEKRARKDAERIKAGMAKAVNMWRTSQYWERRAAGAIGHAKYKELPGVRHRRIKGLEADKRKREKDRESAAKLLKLYADPEAKTKKLRDGRELVPALLATYEGGRGLTPAQRIAYEKKEMSVDDALAVAVENLTNSVRWAERWVEHIDNRLAYERAMLGESGGLVAERFAVEVGGKVLCSGWRRSGGYVVVLKVNRVDGRINSVRTSAGLVSVEEIEDYKAPEAGDVEKVKAATKLPPLVNYPGEGFVHTTSEEYKKRSKFSDFWRVRVIKATDAHGEHRLRSGTKGAGDYTTVGIYLTDAKRVDPPAPEGAKPALPAAEPVAPRPRKAKEEKLEAAVFDGMAKSLKAGVVTVSAPELFATPPELAARMVQLADIEPGMCVLEPSAGTGNIVRAVVNAVDTEVLAYEVNANLCARLSSAFPRFRVQARCRDFLTVEDYAGCYPRVLMNPPFSAEVEHVTHALKMLAPGGRLVAVMSAGVKFRSEKKYAALRELVASCGGSIEDLPEDTFKSAGTSVRTVLVTMVK